ncbi:MAG: methylenetetrahydrofolate reductase C-terminal domain-containing protein [Phycisphaerales bacterium]|nr:methylenetetrahydrofolate reductase C-terminal domain-containing protein [Phycisphaerales bacterium]
MFAKTIARIEALVKGTLFDCRMCGQCVLSQTGLVCPMTCPKGLRNGPCGGTLHGECEVLPDRPCVWVKIHHRTVGDESLDRPNLLPSCDARLQNTSSYLNLLSGADKVGRTPLEYLNLGERRTSLPIQTQSKLEQRLKSGAFVKTCELRAPRGASVDKLDEQASHVRDHFDAVNATAYLNARPSLPSAVVAAKLAELGIDAVCQSTCRDHTKTSFIAELLSNQLNGVHNTLCLTGDSYQGIPKIKQVFDMDGAIMLYEGRHLREKGVIYFTGERVANAPRTFLGAAINPFTEPANVPIRRLKQKAAAGADFIQTQLVFDMQAFEDRFMSLVRQEKIHEDLFILAGIPVVTSKKALEVLPRIPGACVPQESMRRLSSASSCEAEGVQLARELVEQATKIPGLAGVHLMLFGPDHAVLPAVIEKLESTPIHQPATASFRAGKATETPTV